jgi:hypothetical protein
MLMFAPRYSEGLEILCSSTSFVFSRPIDLHCFQQVASPEGFTHVKSLILAYGRTDSGEGLFTESSKLRQEQFEAWGKACQSLQNIRHLRELQILLFHRVPGEVSLTQRPWKEDTGRSFMEQRHQTFFDVLGTVNATEFNVMLSWDPTDMLDQRKWPFQLQVQTADEISGAVEALPGSTLEVFDDNDLYI